MIIKLQEQIFNHQHIHNVLRNILITNNTDFVAAAINSSLSKKESLCLNKALIELLWSDEFQNYIEKSDEIAKIFKYPLREQKRYGVNYLTSYLNSTKIILAYITNKIAKEKRNLIVQESINENKKIKNVSRREERKKAVRQRIEEEKEVLEKEKIFNNFLMRNKKLVQKFMDIASIKVSLINEYGFENWNGLRQEIANLIGFQVRDPFLHEHLKLYRRTGNANMLPKSYSVIAEYLELYFKRNYRRSKSKVFSLDKVERMTGIEFESYISQLLKNYGFLNISGTPITGDQGADLIVNKENKKIVIQIKRHYKPITNKAVQEVVASIRYYNADTGWVITNSIFTQSAKELALRNEIVLIDGSTLENFNKFLKNLNI